MLKFIKKLFCKKRSPMEERLLPLLGLGLEKNEARGIYDASLDFCSSGLDRLAEQPDDLSECISSVQADIVSWLDTAIPDFEFRYGEDYYARRIRVIVAAALAYTAEDLGLVRTFETAGMVTHIHTQTKVKLIAGREALLFRVDCPEAGDIITRLPWAESCDLEELCRLLLEKPLIASAGPTAWIGRREHSPYFLISRRHPLGGAKPLLFLGVCDRTSYVLSAFSQNLGHGVWLDRSEAALLRAFLIAQRRRCLGDPDVAAIEPAG